VCVWVCMCGEEQECRRKWKRCEIKWLLKQQKTETTMSSISIIHQFELLQILKQKMDETKSKKQ